MCFTFISKTGTALSVFMLDLRRIFKFILNIENKINLNFFPLGFWNQEKLFKLENAIFGKIVKNIEK